MPIQVLIEPVANNGFRATSGEPIPLTVEAPTREEALAKLKKRVQARLKNGAEIVTVELAPAEHPLAKFAGMFKDDPDFQEVKEIMAENRRKLDADPDIP